MLRVAAKRVSPITVSDETLLPEPDSPTIPSALPRSTRVGDAVDGLDDAVVGLEMHREVADIEQVRHRAQ